MISRKILSGELTLADVNARQDIIYIQDNVTQIGQGVFADRVHEHLGPADSANIVLRKLWHRELEQFATKRPLKKWTVPQHIDATSGLPEA